MIKRDPNRKSRWYFGGLGASAAVCITHPLDLLKVHLQTVGGSGNEGSSKKVGLMARTVGIVQSQGVLAMYNGLSASVLRQMTHSTVRFGIYDVLKKRVSPNGEDIGFGTRLAMAALGGVCGGVVGTPADIVNVRMQNDVKIPPDQRRHYRHAFDGLSRLYREEGFRKMFRGVEWASSRATLLTIGQICFYDVIKAQLMQAGMQDNLTCHMAASMCSGVIATTMTQPMDVLKTRAMDARPGQFPTPLHLVTFTAKQGPSAFFKGYVPAFIRLGPHTVLTFVFYEQLRLYFGHPPSDSNQ